MKIALPFQPSRNVIYYLGLTILLFPFGVYGWVLISYSYDFPFYDDYMAILEFIYRWIHTASFSEKMALLVEQHNEHRIVYIRLISLIDYYLRGSIHFTDLIFWGNLSLLIVFGGLLEGVNFIKKDQKLWALIPVAFLLFQFQSWDNSLWAMASLANFGIHAWVITALYLATQKGIGAFIGTIAAAFMALGTIGSGLFLFPIVVAIWAVQNRFRTMLGGALILSLALVLYFYGYQQPANYPSIVQTIGQANWGQLLVFCGAFLGSNLYHPAVPYIAPLVGWAGIAWFCFLTYQRYFQKNPFLYGVLAFLVLTASVVALNRYGRGIEGAYPSRYRMNSSLFLAVSFLTMVQLAGTRWIKWVVTAGCISTAGLYLLSVIVYLPRIRHSKELRIADNWLFHHNLPIAGCYRLKYADLMLKKSVQSKIFIPPNMPDELTTALEMNEINRDIPLKMDSTVQNSAVEYDIDWIKNVDNRVAVRGWIRFKKQGVLLKKVIIVVNDQLGYATLFQKRYDLFEKYKNMQYQDTGFLGILPKHDWPDSTQKWRLLAIASTGQRVWLFPK